MPRINLFKITCNYSGPGFCDRAQKQCRPPPAIAEEGEKRSAVFCQVIGVQMFMNDLLTEQGQQRSRVIR